MENKESKWMPYEQYLPEKEYLDKKEAQLIAECIASHTTEIEYTNLLQEYKNLQGRVMHFRTIIKNGWGESALLDKYDELFDIKIVYNGTAGE